MTTLSSKETTWNNTLTLIGIGLIALIIAGLLSGFPLMLLWNWLMPSLFGLKSIGFWEAYGLYMLSSLLFKSHSSSSKR